MSSRRKFLQKSLFLGAAGLFSGELAFAKSAANTSADMQATMDPPPDIFDAQLIDMDFWLKPRVLEVTRPASGEHAKLLYWKDGEVQDSAYQELCHLLRDVQGKQVRR